jgi:hypothetical protein
MGFSQRLRRLEGQLGGYAVDGGFRVAGKSRSEIHAEAIAFLVIRLEARVPGFAAALIETALSGGHLPGNEMLEGYLHAIRGADQCNAGLPRRVLAAVMAGEPALVEEVLFPEGRPQVGYDARDDGERFFLPLDTLK